VSPNKPWIGRWYPRRGKSLIAGWVWAILDPDDGSLTRVRTMRRRHQHLGGPNPAITFRSVRIDTGDAIKNLMWEAGSPLLIEVVDRAQDGVRRDPLDFGQLFPTVSVPDFLMFI